MGQLTTHVLDTMNGQPAAGVRIDLYCLAGERVRVKTVTTNADGRCNEALLQDEALQRGEWELVFHLGDYFRNRAPGVGSMPFLDQVPVRFGIDDSAGHYHVPLLASPWSYTTYRGS